MWRWTASASLGRDIAGAEHHAALWLTAAISLIAALIRRRAFTSE
jgi:hypothetical protein